MASYPPPAGWSTAQSQTDLTTAIGLIRDTIPYYYDNLTLMLCQKNIMAGCMNVWQTTVSGKRLFLMFHLRRSPVGSSGTDTIHYISIGVDEGYDPAATCDALVVACDSFSTSSSLPLAFIRQPELSIPQTRLAGVLAEADSRPGLLDPEVTVPAEAPWPACLSRTINA